MIRVFDFRCDGGHVSEHFVRGDTWGVMCPECGRVATRQMPAPHAKLDGCSGHFPSAADAWERRRESHMRKEQRNVQEHGTYK